MRKIWLSDDKEITLDQEETFCRKVLLRNPEDMKAESAFGIWLRIKSCFGSYEYEKWISEEIISLAMKATARQQIYADLSTISAATLWIDTDGRGFKKVIGGNDYYKKIFFNLPIFKIVSESEEEVILEYVPENEKEIALECVLD